jgi:TolA-binding protein
MSHSGPLVEDLSARARRGDLAPEEQRRLDMALRASLEARLLHEAGLGFDEERSVSRGDDELMLRVVRRVQTRPAARRSAGRGKLWPLLAAAMVGATAAAAASWGLSAVAFRHPAAEVPLRNPAQHTTHGAARHTPAAPAELPGESSLVAPADVTPEPSPTATGPARGASEPATSPRNVPEPEGVRELFRRANALRRSGDLRRAAEAYLELERRFPGSAEARHSHLTLGQLYLAGRAASSALAQFRNYAQAPSSDSLRVEALWGEVQALEMLGRTEQEIQVLEDIATRHPQSVYREAAQQRLARLRSR